MLHDIRQSNIIKLCDKEEVATAIARMDRQRTFLLASTSEEAAPYEDDDFLEMKTLATAPSQACSTDSNAMLMCIFKDLKKEESMRTIVSALKDSITKNRRKKIDVIKFEAKSEDTKTWLSAYEKSCTVNGWKTMTKTFYIFERV